MTVYAGEVRFKTNLDPAGFNKGLEGVVSTLGKVAGMLGIAFGTAAIVAFGKSAVQAASQLESAKKGLEFIANANKQSFENATAFIDKYISDGLVPATDAIEAYKNLLTTGFTTDQIEKMMNVLKDSAVYARQGQFTIGEAIAKTTMGIRMENSILSDSAGIQKNIARMYDDFAKTLGTTAQSLTRAQKNQAIFNGYMAEGGMFAGAAEKYLNSYAGRVAQLGAMFTNLRVAIGNAIIPVINAILPYIISAVTWMTQLFNIAGRVMNLLFGTNVGAKDMEAQAAATQGAADATGQLAENTEKAGKAAKGALASFDKLNVLQQKDEGGSSGGTPVAGGGGGVPVPEPKTDGFAAKLDELEKKVVAFKEELLSLVEQIKSSFAIGDFTELGESLSGGIADILQKMRASVQGFDFTGLGRDIAGIVNKAINSAKTFLQGFDFAAVGGQQGGLLSDILKGLLGTGAGFLETVDWSNLGETVWQGVLSQIQYVVGLVSGFDWSGVVSGVFELIGAAIGGAGKFVVGLGTSIFESLKKAWETVKTNWETFKDEAGGDIWGAILEGIGNAVKNTGDWAKQNIFDPFMKGLAGDAEGDSSPANWVEENIVKPIGEKAAKLWEDIKSPFVNAANWFNDTFITPLKNFFGPIFEWIGIVAYDAWLFIKTVWSVVSAWFNVHVIQPLRSFFEPVWKAISKFAETAWETIKDVWKTVSNWFDTNILTPVKKAFETTWNAISDVVTRVFNGITDTIKAAINGVIGLLNSMLDFAFSDINDLLDGINKVGSKIPGWKWIPEITVPQIPLLATGAVIPPNKPFAAILGDQRNGKNIEAPENLIRKIIREEMGGRNAFPDQAMVQTTVMLDSSVLQRAVKKEQLRIGPSMLSGSGA